jgi:hypothetical protein
LYSDNSGFLCSYDICSWVFLTLQCSNVTLLHEFFKQFLSRLRIIYQKPRKQQEGESKAELLTDVVVTATSIAGAIADYAEEHNMDLIVIGQI